MKNVDRVQQVYNMFLTQGPEMTLWLVEHKGLSLGHYHNHKLRAVGLTIEFLKDSHIFDAESRAFLNNIFCS